MDPRQRGSVSTASRRTKKRNGSPEEHETQLVNTLSDIEGQVSPPDGQDAFGNEEGAEIQYKTCAWWHIGVLMLAENVSLGVFALPQALAILGIFPGLLCICFLGMNATYTGWLIGEFKLAFPQVQSFPDCGELIAGRIGREAVALGSVLILIFISGAHILTFAVAINALTDHGTCSIVFAVVGLIICLLLGLPRTYKNVSKLSILSGHVAFLSFQSELADPREFKKALFFEQGVAITFYITISAVIYYYAGPLVTSPALGSASPVVTKITFGLAIPTIIIAGVVNGSVACKYIYIRTWKGTNVVHEKSAKSLGSWYGICIVFWIVAWILAESIPNFNLLLGLIAALFGSWFSYALPIVMWPYQHKGTWFKNTRWAMWSALDAFLFCIGVAIFVLGMYTSGTELHNGSGGKVFLCANNWSPVSAALGQEE